MRNVDGKGFVGRGVGRELPATGGLGDLELGIAALFGFYISALEWKRTTTLFYRCNNFPGLYSYMELQRLI